jgi:hypothetical protein
MLELMNRAAEPLHSVPAAAEPPSTSTLLARTLDEVDFGIALLRADGEVLHLNHRRGARCRVQARCRCRTTGWFRTSPARSRA